MLDRAIVLYGSRARGDDDEWSDIDLLVVGATADLPEGARHDGDVLGRPVRVSHYTWREFTAMGRHGSLFLHHLAAEAKPLVFEGLGSGRYEDVLSALPPYRFAERDLRAFRTGVGDVCSGLAVGSPPSFEMAVLGGIARHWSVLACYLAGDPTFGRRSIRRASELFGAPEAGERLVLAHRYRLFEEQQCPRPPGVDLRDVRVTAAVCDRLFDVTERSLNAHN